MVSSIPSRTRPGARASPVPLAAGVVATLLSLGLAVLTAATVRWEQPISGFMVPLADPRTLPLSVAGYVLTPFAVILAFGWNRAAQRRGLAEDRNFVLRPSYGSVLRVLLVASFAVALWHILGIANVFGGGLS